MGFINYIKACVSGLESSGIEQITSIIGLAMLGIFALSVVWKMFKGFRKGARRQVLSTVMILISVGLAMILTKIATNIAIGYVTVENIQNLATSLGMNSGSVAQYIDVLKDFPVDTLQYILSIPMAVMIAPILFLVIYFVVRFITFIAQIIIKSVVHVKKAANLGERFAGLCLGAVEAIIIASVIILPITSVVSFADEVITTISSPDNEASDNEDFGEFREVYDTYIQPTVINCPAFWLADNAANNTVTSVISSVSNSSGESANIHDEFIDVLEIFFVEVPELREVDFKQPNTEEKTLIENVINRLAENQIINTVLSGTISTTATIMTPENLEKLGVKLDPPLDGVVNDVLNIMRSCTTATLKDDMHLIKNIYFLLADEEILLHIDDNDNLLDALITKEEGEEKTPVQRLIALINENDRTKPLITTLTKLSITMLANGLGNTEFDVNETYEELKGTMNEVLSVDSSNFETHEEYIEEVANVLDTNLRDNGIEIEDREIITTIAEYIDENYSETTEVTDEEFNDILLSYFDAYLEYQNSGVVPDDILPPGFNPEDLPGGVTPDNLSPTPTP